jgi:hypothetical protein
MEGPPAQAAAAWLRLIDEDDQVLADPDIQTKTAALLARADLGEDPMRKVFEQLAYRAGPTGLDVLYRVVDEHPESSAAERTAPVLYQQGIAGRASPALTVTLDIRRMNCARKIQQFHRAGVDGDLRTLHELEKLQPPGCVVRKGECCFKDDPKLQASLAQLRARESAAGK